MMITNETTITQIAELMGSCATEKEGRIMMGILSREGVIDTQEVHGDVWMGWMSEVTEIIDSGEV